MLVIHNSNENSIISATAKMESRVVMCVVPVNAMLYCCSQGTFINTDLAKKLKAKSMKTTIKIKTLNGKNTKELEEIRVLKF